MNIVDHFLEKVFISSDNSGDQASIRKFRASDIDDVHEELYKLVNSANKSVFVFINTPPPAIMTYRDDAITQSLVAFSAYKHLDVNFFVKKKNNDSDFKKFIIMLEKYHFKIIQNENTKFIDGMSIGNETLKKDNFFIFDSKHICWIKPEKNEAEFIYNEPLIANQVYGNILKSVWTKELTFPENIIT